MQIIDKNKDYYDYCQFEYGPVDKTVTYDRRGSKIITEEDFLRYYHEEDLENNTSRRWGYPSLYKHILLEVGNIQYILGYERDSKIIGVLQMFDNEIHLCKAPMTLTRFRCKRKYEGKKYNFYPESGKDIIPFNGEDDLYFCNPILKDTVIPSIIPARDIYNALDNYFRSMYNDKTIEINNSDVDKAINHGFDKKTSFRHPVKL